MKYAKRKNWFAAKDYEGAVFVYDKGKNKVNGWRSSRDSAERSVIRKEVPGVKRSKLKLSKVDDDNNTRDKSQKLDECVRERFGPKVEWQKNIKQSGIKGKRQTRRDLMRSGWARTGQSLSRRMGLLDCCQESLTSALKAGLIAAQQTSLVNRVT